MNSLQHARVDHVFSTNNAECVDNFKRKVNNYTFYKFEVEACPHQGTWIINVVSKRPETSNEELKDALIAFLATELAKG